MGLYVPPPPRPKKLAQSPPNEGEIVAQIYNLLKHCHPDEVRRILEAVPILLDTGAKNG